MGSILNESSMNKGGLIIHKQKTEDKVIALAGNPNVGKSTVFNHMTGLKQHTGNWPGKTVTNAQGYFKHQGKGYVMVDLPGCYSLMAHSAEEEAARDFICFEHPDAVIVVCDATCLERNMNLVLQIIEATSQVIVCVNLMDEAKKKGIEIHLYKLEERLCVPVVGTAARSGKGLSLVYEKMNDIAENKTLLINCKLHIEYDVKVEELIQIMQSGVETSIMMEEGNVPIHKRWLAARLLDADEGLLHSINQHFGYNIMEDEKIVLAKTAIEEKLLEFGLSKKSLEDMIAAAFVKKAEEICQDVVTYKRQGYDKKDRAWDRLFTGKITGFPVMFLVLLGIFWITITGANYPSAIISRVLFRFEDYMVLFFQWFNLPAYSYEWFVFGVYRVLAWVVAVMLPPMAIFFPLFTLLEDFGFLPRVAYNLDRCFHKCKACGKQALTMAMGFGCNAAGVTGCRIIDSKRERLIAMITNNFVPCNGRFPTLISIITMFFVGAAYGLGASVKSALILSTTIILGIIMTLLISRVLSETVLKGVPSSFTLELPPYRRPQVGKVIVRSIFNRTLFVLGRAVMVAAPAGLIIWLMANITIDGNTLLTLCSNFLDPFGRLLGMDGVIILAFILGFPANEIVVPIIIMAYMSNGSIVEMDDLKVLKQLLIENGWTWITAISTMLFSLMHWPCATTCLTIKKESGSMKWTLISIFVPTVVGIIVCFTFASIARFFL